MAANNQMGQEDLSKIVTSVFPTQIEPGSLADRLLKQGREEGIEQGIEKGIEQGIEQGKLVGKIQTLQEILKISVMSDEILGSLSQDELSAIMSDLRKQLRARES